MYMYMYQSVNFRQLHVHTCTYHNQPSTCISTYELSTHYTMYIYVQYNDSQSLRLL